MFNSTTLLKITLPGIRGRAGQTSRADRLKSPTVQTPMAQVIQVNSTATT